MWSDCAAGDFGVCMGGIKCGVILQQVTLVCVCGGDYLWCECAVGDFDVCVGGKLNVV